MKISSAIVDVVVELIELKEKNATQIETEKAKLAQMGTNERLDFLLQQKAEVFGNFACLNWVGFAVGHKSGRAVRNDPVHVQECVCAQIQVQL